MSRKTKLWVITACVLIVIGCILFGGVMTVMKWDFNKLSTVTFETNMHAITDDFTNIDIRIDTADITFIPAEGEICTVTCYERANGIHSVSVQDGTLVITAVSAEKWYRNIGIQFQTAQITVALPREQYDSLTIKRSTGDLQIPAGFAFESIRVSGSTGDAACDASAREISIKASTGNIKIQSVAETMDLTVSTGKITVTNAECSGDLTIHVTTGKVFLDGVQCRNLVSTGDTGNTKLTNVIATDSMNIERSTGDVTFDRCDAGEITVKTDTGDVRGSLLSDKIFFTTTDTGKIDTPKSVSGGKCEITTDTGDIIITVE